MWPGRVRTGRQERNSGELLGESYYVKFSIDLQPLPSRMEPAGQDKAEPVHVVGGVWGTSVVQRKNKDSRLTMPLNTRVILVRTMLIETTLLVEIACRTDFTPWAQTSYTEQSVSQFISIHYKWHQFLVTWIQSAEANQPNETKLATTNIPKRVVSKEVYPALSLLNNGPQINPDSDYIADGEIVNSVSSTSLQSDWRRGS